MKTSDGFGWLFILSLILLVLNLFFKSIDPIPIITTTAIFWGMSVITEVKK